MEQIGLRLLLHSPGVDNGDVDQGQSHTTVWAFMLPHPIVSYRIVSYPILSPLLWLAGSHIISFLTLDSNPNQLQLIESWQ